jgi:sensor histidine kinase YesM
MKVFRWITAFIFFTSIALVFTQWFLKIEEFHLIKTMWIGKIESQHKFSKENLYFVNNGKSEKFQAFKYLGKINDHILINYSKDSIKIPAEILKSYKGIKYEVVGLFYDKQVYPKLIKDFSQNIAKDSSFQEDINVEKEGEFQQWTSSKNMLACAKRESFFEAFDWIPLHDKITLYLQLHPIFIVIFIAILSLILLGYEWLINFITSTLIKKIVSIFLLYLTLNFTVSNPIIYEFNFWFTHSFFLLSAICIISLVQWISSKSKIKNSVEFEILKFISTMCNSIVVFIVLLYFLDIIYYDILKKNTHQEASPIWWYATQVQSRFVLIFATANLIKNILKNYYIKNKENIQSEIQLLQAEKDKMELASLHARINPHFLYNSLNSIASLATIDADKTEKMTTKLADFYKYNTNRNASFHSTLRDELQMVDTYLEIEKIRFGEKLIIKYQINESMLDFVIPSALLQPLVENAIKYGYNTSTKRIYIIIEIKSTDTDLIINIYDSGEPFKEDVNTGFGLQSVMRKLEIMYGDSQNLALLNEPEKHLSIIIKK